MSDPEYLTANEAAALLRCKKTKFAYMRRARLLPKPIMFGRVPLWIKSELKDHIEANRGAY